jgi:hypothetical protein
MSRARTIEGISYRPIFAPIDRSGGHSNTQARSGDVWFSRAVADIQARDRMIKIIMTSIVLLLLAMPVAHAQDTLNYADADAVARYAENKRFSDPKAALSAIDRFEQNGRSDTRLILVRGFVYLCSGERQRGEQQIDTYLDMVGRIAAGNVNTNRSYALRLKRVSQLPPREYGAWRVLQKINWRLGEQADIDVANLIQKKIGTIEIGRESAVEYNLGSGLTSVTLPSGIRRELEKTVRGIGFPVSMNQDLPFVTWLVKIQLKYFKEPRERSSRDEVNEGIYMVNLIAQEYKTGRLADIKKLMVFFAQEQRGTK